MKLLVTIIAAVVLVGCGESQQSSTTPETKPTEQVAETAKPEPPTAKAPDISIHDAAGDGNIEAVKQHLASGTDVNAKGGLGLTTLHFAAGFSRGGVGKEIAELLIANGADVNARDDDGWNPLHWVAFEGKQFNKEVGELLIAKGADINAGEDNAGWTPLHVAAYSGYKAAVELLAAKGADVNAKDEDGKTSLDWATHPDNPNASAEIADLLRKHGGKTGAELKAEGK